MLFLFRPEQDSQSYISADEVKRKLKKLKDSAAPMSKDAGQQDQNKVLISDLILNPVHLLKLKLYINILLSVLFVPP